MTQSYVKQVIITRGMVQLFGDAVNDHNPIHFNEQYAATTRFGRTIVHGALIGGLISGMLVESYGEGTIYVSTELTFENPVFVGDSVAIELTTGTMNRWRQQVHIIVHRNDGKIAVKGEAWIIPGAPTE